MIIDHIKNVNIYLVMFKQPSMVNNNNFNNGYFCALMHMKHMAIRNAYLFHVVFHNEFPFGYWPLWQS